MISSDWFDLVDRLIDSVVQKEKQGNVRKLPATKQSGEHEVVMSLK